MDMPPSRYKVVEKGRRLVVVDRLTGEAVHHQLPGPPPARRAELPPSRMEQPRPESRAPMPSPRPQLAGPGRVFTTDSWYDDKAPRTLQLTDDAMTALLIVGGVIIVLVLAAFVFIGFVALVVLAVILGQKGVRAALRRGATSWLDSLPTA